MDRLDELEAQSIFILREAFARLHKLALLWSLGKDSNVMIWLARKAFFGRVPFPAMHVDTGKKFPEMYAFRDRYAKEWDLDLIVEPCPPIEAVDPTLPPAARSAARKTEGLKLALAKHGFDGLIAGIRRDEEADARQGAGVFAARRRRRLGRSRPAARNSGTTSTPRRRPARICASIRSCIGPKPTSGATRAAKAFRSSRSISRTTASVIARWATQTSRPRSLRTRARSTKSSPSSKPPHSGTRRPRHGPRIRRRLRAAAHRRLSVTLKYRQRVIVMNALTPVQVPAAVADPGRPLVRIVIVGPCRSRQVDADRPPAARDRQPARRQARAAQGCQRAARHAVRMVVPARCAADRARPEHHASTPARSASARRARDFVLIDAPGHAEFLRNMITGAAQADAAILIIDADRRRARPDARHGYLLQLLGIRQVVVVDQQDGPHRLRRRLVSARSRPKSRAISAVLG